MLSVLFAITSLIFVTVIIHMEGLWLIREWTERISVGQRMKLSVVVLQTLVLHVIEIGLYGVALLLADRYLSVGHLQSTHHIGLLDYFYFSAETFTAVGYGDIIVSGDLRLIASIEPLNGLMLISWSGAFTFLAMQRYWSGRIGQLDN